VTSLRLIQFTDTHLLARADDELRGVRTWSTLRACLARAREWHFPADALLLSGDLVQDEPAGYSAIRSLYGALGVPVLVIPGNHDVPDRLGQTLGDPPFQVGGTFPLGEWLLVLLSSWYAESVDGEGRLGGAQLASLEAALRRHAPRPALVCVHHPAVSMDSTGIDELGLTDAAALLEIVDRHDCVRGVAWGHAHQALDVYRADKRLMCAPSTCIQFRPRRARIEVDDRPPGYRVIDLHANGSLSSEVVWLEEGQN
jgi:Icc protein